ncbi:MAG TPA: alpha-amylase family glycosyl hydrolase, partial [Acholeplasmataceae bacterium]|nr:alpha-amylase family glycosyl hydrolase [Acholeplasmataceae bacterium]
MAKQTDIMLRTWTFYQVFPRQHSKTHDLKGVINDLDRIKDLGVDVIYVLPLHPIGKKARKGSQGSPYSIVNYREIHSDLG